MSFFGPRKPAWLDNDFNPFVNRNGQRPLPHQEIFSPRSNVPMFVNAVYYPNWHIYKQRPPSSLKLEVISHIFYAFAWVRDDGTVYLSDDWADDKLEVSGHQGCLRACVALKRQYPHLKVLLSVGGGGKGGENFASVASDANRRATFSSSCRALCDTYRLDGIDIDWEHPSSPLQGQHYDALLSSIRQYLPSPLFTLTSALPGSEWALRNIVLSLASRHLDYINLMCYDYAGPWTPTSGHHARLFAPPNAPGPSGAAAVQYCVSQSVPPGKILLGIPCYGRSFLSSSGPGQPYAGHGGNEGTFEYVELPRPGSHVYVDEEAVAACCVGRDGGFVTYDVPRTVGLKARFVRERGLGGLFYWTGTGDRVDGGEGEGGSLVMAGYCELHR